MERHELALVIGMILAGRPPVPMPMDQPMQPEDMIRWTKIRDANRAERVIPLVSRPLLPQVPYGLRV